MQHGYGAVAIDRAEHLVETLFGVHDVLERVDDFVGIISFVDHVHEVLAHTVKLIGRREGYLGFGEMNHEDQRRFLEEFVDVLLERRGQVDELLLIDLLWQQQQLVNLTGGLSDAAQAPFEVTIVFCLELDGERQPHCFDSFVLFHYECRIGLIVAREGRQCEDFLTDTATLHQVLLRILGPSQFGSNVVEQILKITRQAGRLHVEALTVELRLHLQLLANFLPAIVEVGDEIARLRLQATNAFQAVGQFAPVGVERLKLFRQLMVIVELTGTLIQTDRFRTDTQRIHVERSQAGDDSKLFVEGVGQLRGIVREVADQRAKLLEFRSHSTRGRTRIGECAVVIRTASLLE